MSLLRLQFLIQQEGRAFSRPTEGTTLGDAWKSVSSARFDAFPLGPDHDRQHQVEAAGLLTVSSLLGKWWEPRVLIAIQVQWMKDDQGEAATTIQAASDQKSPASSKPGSAHHRSYMRK
jgi:hypothetical protein